MARSTVYNSNLTNDYDQVSDNNKRLVQDYLTYLHSMDRSLTTILQYEEWLKVFFCWNLRNNNNKFFVDLKKRDFVYYIGWCRDLGMSPKRIASLKSVLSSLSNEIESMDGDLYPNFHNQLRTLEPIHLAPVRTKTVISEEEVEKILTGLVEKQEYQLACYFALACASGSRKSELLQMKPSFFTEDTEVFDGYMYSTPEIRSKGRGKQGKIIKKYVIKELFKPFFDLWMKQREELGIDSEYLFVKKQGNEYLPAVTSTANTFARNISELFNIEYYSHSSRHYFCTYLRGMNLPDEVIRLIFSWESTDLIKIYDDTPVDVTLGKFFKSFGAGDLKVKGE